MKKLSVIIGILAAETACGMPNPMQQGVNNNNSVNGVNNYAVNPNSVGNNGVNNYAVNPNSVGNISKENIEGNAVFLPVMNRRFSDGMINFSVWPGQVNQNPGMQNGGCTILRQPQNVGVSSVQGNANGTYINQVCNQQKLSVRNVPNSSVESVPQEINGNTNENMMFLPVLRGSGSGSQTNNTGKLSYSKIRKDSFANAMPQQSYNNQEYFPPSRTNNDIMTPAFTLNDILQVAERQAQLNREMNRELSALRRQNEILKKEIENYRAREMYFFPNKIAQLQGKIMNLEEFIISQNQKHQEELDELKDQQSKDVKLGRMVALEQKNAELEEENRRYRKENTREKIKRLENKVKELQSQIREKNSLHETEISDLKEKLREEKQLNMALGLSSGSILESKK